MKLKTRIWMLPIMAALVFAVGLAAVIFFGAQTSSAIRLVGSAHYPYLDANTRLAAQLKAFDVTIQSAVAEGEQKRLDEAKETATVVRKLLDDMSKMEGRAGAAQALRGSADAYLSAAIGTAELFLGTAKGDQAAAIKNMQEAQQALNKAVEASGAQAKGDFVAGLASAEHGVSASRLAVIVLAVVVVLSLGVGSWLLISSVWRQIGGEPEYAREVIQQMAQGDLSGTVVVEPSDTSSLLAAVREMASGLTGLVSNVRVGTDSMSVASREIAAGNHDLSDRTEKQAGSLEQTSSTMRDLTEAVRHSADAAAQANQLASSAATVAERGGQVVGQVVQTMQEINASSKRINDIIGVIDGIAFQTNILALNAAVEAARAGEQGRGFAVVASEVRSLAQRSADAAKEIKSLISTSVERVEAGTSLVQTAGATMSDIVASVQRVSDVIAEVTSAAGAQSSGISEINDAVSRLDQMTQQNAALVEEAAAAASSLEQQAMQLQEAVAVFKL